MPVKSSRKFCVIALLLTLVMMIFVKGCNENNPSQPNKDDGLALKIFANPDTQAKLTGLTIDIVGLDEAGQPASPTLPTISISGSSLPVTVPVTLYDPPCRYLVTATASLTHDAPRTASRVLDVCSESRLTIQMDTFEGFWLAVNPLRAPASVNAGAAADVVCGTNQLDAPDKAQYPLQATLSETNGQTISGAFDVNVAVAGSFADPYPLSDLTEQRNFTCVISDGHSTPQTFTVSVKRIPATQPPAPPVPPTDPQTPPVAPPVPPVVPGVTNLTIALAASPSPVPFGTNATTLTITLRDSAGNLWTTPVAVALTATNGNLSQSSLTIANGSGTVTLSDDGLLSRPQSVSVSAQVTSAGYASNTANTAVTFAAQVITPLTVTVAASPNLVTFGTNETTLTITLTDSAGNVWTNPTDVLVRVSGGNLSQSTPTIIGGSGTVKLSEDGTLPLTSPVDVTVSAQVTSPGYTGSGNTLSPVTFQEIPPTSTLYRSYFCGTTDGRIALCANDGVNGGDYTNYIDSVGPGPGSGDCILGEILASPSGTTKPLYLKYRNDVSAGTPVKDDHMSTDTEGELNPQWVSQGPLGHILREPVPGRTIPLYRRHQDYRYRPSNLIDSTDYMTTLDPNENGILILGTGWITDRGVGNPLGHILKSSSGSCP